MDFIEHLKQSVDIVSLIGEYVRLKRQGSGPRYAGLCPFHTEKTPSFSVHSTHGFYKCFGCGVSGDSIKFVMEIERLEFWDAVRLIAERNGIPLPKRSEHSDEDTRRKARLFEMQELAARHFRDNLRGAAGKEARDYLERRGVSPGAQEDFALGYAERGGTALTRLLERRGFSHEEGEAAGLILRRQDGSGAFDRFRHRLMFPIHSEAGKVIGFGGRALDPGEEPKYLNSPKTDIYNKSSVLYNLHRAKEAIRRSGRSILVEGYMDVIGVSAAGVKEVVATCGTALASGQVRALKRHSDQLVVNFDPDPAGANATERSIQVLLDEGMRLRVVSLEGGLDPDEYIRAHGVEDYSSKVEAARNYFYWLADRARARFDMRTAEGRVAAFQFLLPAIHLMPDRLQRLAVAGDVAEYLHVEQGVVLDEFRRAAAERRAAPRRPGETPPEATEVLLLNALLSNAEARREVLPELRLMPGLERVRSRRLFETLLKMDEAGVEISYAQLEARLAEGDREVLTRLVFADESIGEMVTTEQAQACVRRLASAARAARRQELRGQVRDAERAGDLARALALAAQLSHLEREGG